MTDSSPTTGADPAATPGADDPVGTGPAPVDPWASVVAAPDALARLRATVIDPVHAWLLVGPPGSGTVAASRALAAELIAARGPGDGDRHRRLVLEGTHPDLHVVAREGAQVSVAQAEGVVREASRSPVEGERSVIILEEFHVVLGPAAAKLLKVIEEPPPGTFFVVVAEDVPPELVTIASRCLRVDFPPLATETVEATLIAEGVEADRAATTAAAAHGDLDRARLLVTDDRLTLRLEAWRSVPERLDGTGARAATLADEVRAAIDDAAGPLQARQQAETEAMADQVARYGERGSGSRTLTERHRREMRRLRTDELRLGLAELARRYRDELTTAEEPGPLIEGLGALSRAAEALVRNPSEALLIEALFCRLPPLHATPRTG